MKIRALVEEGEDSYSKLISMKLPLIAQKRRTLIIDGKQNLTLVGKIEKDGRFIHRNYKSMDNPRGFSSLSKLNARALILKDGRVFYDISKTDQRDPNELYPLDLFIGEQFGAYGTFEERFEELYKNYLN